MLNTLLNDLNRNILDCGGKELEISDYFREKKSLKGDSVIRSWLWSVPGFRRWRVTRMDAGEKLQVLNSVAYPEFSNDMPIMGIDILWFGVKQKLVAILDFQPLLQDKDYFDLHFQGLQAIKKSFSDFSNSNIMNSYDVNKYFSPWVLFCRGGQFEMNSSLPVIFNRFLQSYLDHYKQSMEMKSKISIDEVKRLHICYDIYNSERDPAHGLFKSYFGKDWADSFLSEFLFPYMSLKDQI